VVDFLLQVARNIKESLKKEEEEKKKEVKGFIQIPH